MEYKEFSEKLDNWGKTCSSCKYLKSNGIVGRGICNCKKSNFFEFDMDSKFPKCDEWRYCA